MKYRLLLKRGKTGLNVYWFLMQRIYDDEMIMKKLHPIKGLPKENKETKNNYLPHHFLKKTNALN